MIFAWRHPRPQQVNALAKDRCIGRTDVPVDPRRARRLARRIARSAHEHGLPHIIWTSPLQRCADVGRWLRRWGWRHHIDTALIEMDFGAWDGLPWGEIARAEVEAWNNGFAHYAPGGGESLTDVLTRVAAWQPGDGASGAANQPGPVLIVAHAGWMRARRWLDQRDAANAAPLTSATLPAAPGYGTLWKLGAP